MHLRNSENVMPPFSNIESEKSILEKAEGYKMAVELSARIGDIDNAKQLCKEIGCDDSVITGLISRSENINITPEVKNLMDRLMRKVVRWLTTKDDWKDRDMEYRFDVREEPEFIELVKSFKNLENFYEILAQYINSNIVDLLPVADHPYEPHVSGVQLAVSDDKILLLNGAVVSFYNKTRATPTHFDIPTTLK